MSVIRVTVDTIYNQPISLRMMTNENKNCDLCVLFKTASKK